MPEGGRYAEALNTDDPRYGGGGVNNAGSVVAGEVPAHGLPYSLSLTLPPLAAIVLKKASDL